MQIFLKIFKQSNTPSHYFLKQIKDPSKIIANTDDPGVFNLLSKMKLIDKVKKVSAFGKNKSANYKLEDSKL